MSFLKTKGFKYLKNLIIGVGASVVLLGALFKIMSWQFADEMLIAGMITEAILFFFLGVIGPEKDYYWEKLYPGLDAYDAPIQPITTGISTVAAPNMPGLNGEVVEQQLGGMLQELQGMSKSLGSLKALQEVDFSGTKDQLKAMNNFYTKLNEAMADLTDSAEETKVVKDGLTELNKNISKLNTTYSSLNTVYGSVITSMANVRQG
ncbi:MAG TPA: gliding motility protein GldL [Haliscomenobacter sp.]|uniref:type IX secretion system motor protein PorL/GldL n=1 Tax=Haliscomenobacter sp. TaxID=2717303 RepID=UPI001D472BA6|nr:gliding motility protein GldL [Haliscomenobacter sp.]MBK9490170.1 gliding motility protein GldL [Haliscomenobacter sp.]HOY18091.1 gliding motility protein GldL [Haliscomenobacter sp.]